MPIVTLTTDFGTQDAYVGVMKGVILSIVPQATLVDLCHEVPPQSVRAGAFVLYQAVPYFPPDSVHLVVVDPGVGGQRRPMAVRTERGVFVAPDNGVLSLVLDSQPPLEIVELRNVNYHLQPASATFHGRDLFAPAAAYAAKGVPLSAMGPTIDSWVSLPPPAVETNPSGDIVAHVMHVDHFGNLILDVTADRIGYGVSFAAGRRRIARLSRTFSDVPSGHLVAYEGSTHGHIEIAVRDGNAADHVGLRVGDQVLIRRRR